MVGAWVGALVLLTLAGAALTWLGARGRRLDDHPHCRRCRYDLVGLADGATVCPECGCDLARSRAVRIGIRRRRPVVLAWGVVVLLIAASGGGFFGWQQQRGFDWNTVKPVWWLRIDLKNADPATADAALAELVRRMNAGALSDEVVQALVPQGLAAQGDLSSAWNPDWGAVIEWAWAREMLTEAELQRYLLQGVSPAMSVTTPERVRVGQPLPVTLSQSAPRLSSARGPRPFLPANQPHLLVQDKLVSVIAGGDELWGRPGYSLSIGSLYPGPGSSSTTTGVRLDLEPGEHDLVLTYQFAVLRGDPYRRRPDAEPPSDSYAEWTMEFPLHVEVTEGYAVTLRDDPALADAIRSSIVVDLNHHRVLSGSSTQTNLDQYGFVGIDDAPDDLAFKVLLRADGVEKEAGSILAEAGRNRRVWLDPQPRELFPEATVVDVILRSSAEVAERNIQMMSIWGGEIVFTDLSIVPVVFAELSREEQEQEIRRLLRVRVTRVGRRVSIRVTPVSPTMMPVGIAFEIVCRSGGREQTAGRVACNGRGRSGSRGGMLDRGTRDDEVATIDILLRPSPEVAKELGIVDASEIWAGEILFEDVPIE